ncbi:MAG: hypothetical protein KKA16_11910 [Alphaproteobacteria bacterium]|nr:hypothetical protein [Alphaproteobacteria bacterium]MBU2377724.1 hypothetical protein [Alphaproteobacteria bacterium]
MSIRLASLVLCALLFGCSPRSETPEEAYQPRSLTADQVANLIAADGAAHTVAVLSGPADPTGIDKVFAGVATGAPEWLALVPAIQPETDGMYAEGLQDALATALTHNAPGVLALIPDHASPLFVCAATSPPDARMIAARAAVEAVTDPGLQAAKTECIRHFEGDQVPAEG